MCGGALNGALLLLSGIAHQRLQLRHLLLQLRQAFLGASQRSGLRIEFFAGKQVE